MEEWIDRQRERERDGEMETERVGKKDRSQTGGRKNKDAETETGKWKGNRVTERGE